MAPNCQEMNAKFTGCRAHPARYRDGGGIHILIQPRRQSDTSEALRISPSDFYMPFLTPMSELLPNPPSGTPPFGFSLTHAESFVGRPRTAVVLSGPPLLLHREGCLQAERTRSKAESSSLLPECTAIVDAMTVPQSIQASSLATRFGELRACPQRRPFAESGQRRVECFT